MLNSLAQQQTRAHFGFVPLGVGDREEVKKLIWLGQRP